MTARLLATYNAETGTVGQVPPAPLRPVSGPNSLIIANNPVYSGTKSYEMSLSRTKLITPTDWNPYRTECKGLFNPEFNRIYWFGIAFRRTMWDTDSDAESWPFQLHEAPNDWGGWGEAGCTQSALSTAPFFCLNVNNTFRFNRFGGVTLWTKPIDINVWHTIVLQIKVSQTATGFIRTWYDGVEQPRYPTSGFAQTHRADSVLTAAGRTCVGTYFVNPLFATGCYKWNWQRKATDSLSRKGYIDAIKIADDIEGNDDAGGYAMVNPAGGGIVDTTPPVISNLVATSVNANAERITWNTNEAATSVVDYGLTTSYSNTINDTNLVTAHTVNLTSLAASTLYNYRVRTADALGNSSSSNNSTFTTAALADSISNIVATPTADGVTITWTTNTARSSVVDYGLTETYDLNVNTGTLVTSHSKTITGLTAGTLYHYRLSGVNASSGSISSIDRTFTTLSAITNIHITYVDTVNFRVDWDTSLAVTSTVRYGLTSSYGNVYTKPVPASLAHSVRIENLTPGTTYHYQVGSFDDNIWSTDQTITLTALAEAITNVAVAYISPSSVTITWNTTGSSNSTVSYGLGLTLANTPVTVETLTTNHSVTLTELTPNKTYYYKVKSVTAGGASIESSLFALRTKTISGGLSDGFN